MSALTKPINGLDATEIRRRAEYRYMYDPEFHARVYMAVRITEQAITNGGYFTREDQDVATSAAATALFLRDCRVDGR